MVALRRFRNPGPSFADLVPYAGLVDDGVILLKDGSLIGRAEDAELRRVWRQRLDDHDGNAPGEGGIVRWLALTDDLGLDRDYVISERGILPGTKFSVEAYVHFVRERSLLEAVASSLPPSATITSAAPASHADFAARPIDAASFSAGMITENRTSQPRRNRPKRGTDAD